MKVQPICATRASIANRPDSPKIPVHNYDCAATMAPRVATDHRRRQARPRPILNRILCVPAQIARTGLGDMGDVVNALAAQSGETGKEDAAPGIAQKMAVRRLTPRECERLQGFPDDYTLVPYRCKPAADGPRYNACGNSMAVNVMNWLGERIALVDELIQQGEN